MATVADRLEVLMSGQLDVTGIDFIYIHPSQELIDVYFFLDPLFLNDPLSHNTGLIEIYSPTGAAIPIIPEVNGFPLVDGIHVLRLKTVKGNFALYNLKIHDDRIDPYFNDVSFSYKANCPSDLDCKPVGHECPFEEPVDFPIDYTARDFWSYRRALLEFATLRYPDWPDRLAADAGIMLAEIMSAAGDEMAYYQDRIAREAYLETATQRRSIRRHARLVDHHLHDGLGSSVWIDVTAIGIGGTIPKGTDIWAIGENNSRIDFEIGEGLKNTLTNTFIQYNVTPAQNEMKVHRWDEDQVCLPVGTTEMYLEGKQEAHLVTFTGAPPSDVDGKWVLLKTIPGNPAQPARNIMVRIIFAKNTTDPVLGGNITHIKWDKEQALPFEMDMTIMVLHANMVPATSGKTFEQYFITGADLEELPPADAQNLEAITSAKNLNVHRAIERESAFETITYLFSLADSEETNLVWLGIDPARSNPEVHLEQLEFNGMTWVPSLEDEWEWRNTLVGISSSDERDTHFTLDDGTWRRVVGYWRQGTEIIHEDYASGRGFTIRFGDGEFGLIPKEKTVFKIYYRLGGTRLDNVAADTITEFDNKNAALNSVIGSITNPLNAINGSDPESASETRQSAPQEFRAITYRAVRPEDYAEAVERLPWVQKAGAELRWTGSWLTLFATPDPSNAVSLTTQWRKELAEQLNRFRQAGREAHGMDPLYADIDLDIEVCVSPDCYPGEVKERIMIKLFGKKGLNPVKGFFSPDRFSFGDPLERSALEAAIQSVPGVKAVEEISFRRRSFFDWRLFDHYSYGPGRNSIIRIENDLAHPERGILKLHTHGGA